MIFEILNTVAPVFLLLLFGNAAVRAGVLSADVIDGLMKFSTHIALPCLLFRATSTIDLVNAYDWRVLFSYFGTATICFALAIVVAQKLFARRPGEAVAVGFSALFANMVLMGLPIVDRAFGSQGVDTAITIISMNAPFCYLVGIVVMESVRADGRSYAATTIVVIKTMFKNALMIGIALGFLVNLSGVVLPETLVVTVDMLKSAALPCALFALGGLLARYSLAQELTESSALSVIALFVSPCIAYGICTVVGLSGVERSVIVVLAAVPPGLNAYLFASMYSRGMGTASSNVLMGTVCSVLSVSFWLWLMS